MTSKLSGAVDVFVKINAEEIVRSDKLRLNIDVATLKDGTPAANQRVFLDLNGARRVLNMPEAGILKDQDLIFQINDGVRLRLLAWANEVRKSGYEISPPGYEEGIRSKMVKKVTDEMVEAKRKNNETIKRITGEMEKEKQRCIEDLAGKNEKDRLELEKHIGDLKSQIDALTPKPEPVRTPVNVSPEFEFCAEHVELLEKLKGQYSPMCDVLRKYGIEIRFDHSPLTKTIPKWKQINDCLNPEVLDKVLDLAEPTLLLVPPTTRRSKLIAVCGNPENNIHSSEDYQFDNGNLWNEGSTKTKYQWRVMVVEGFKGLYGYRSEGKVGSTDSGMVEALLKGYLDKGLDVMCDADAYLTLLMMRLAEGVRIDTNTCTILNAKNMIDSSCIAYGRQEYAFSREDSKYYNLYLGHAELERNDMKHDLLLRGVVAVNVPQA